LSTQTEHSEGPSTLPPPELNPLVNPLLAENMGRWAQVYFTSPPEKREHAVQELLRELGAEYSARAEGAGALSSSLAPVLNSPSTVVAEQGSEPMVSPGSQASEVRPAPIRCHACGRKNPSSQKFCGMCGTRLGDETAVADLHREDLRQEGLHHQDLQHEDAYRENPHREDFQTAHPQVEDLPIENPRLDEPAPFVLRRKSQFVPQHEDVYETRLNRNELSLFQSSRDVSYNDEEMDALRASGSYRIFAMIVVVIIVGSLGYLAWRNAQSSWQTSHSKPPVSFAADEPVSSEPVSSTPSKTDIPDRGPSAAPSAEDHAALSHDAAEPTRALPTRKEPARKAANAKADTATQAALRTAPRTENNLQAEAWTGGGSEELALAQGYLSGTNGKSRNSAEAAKWLWKAIAKHNADATFLLSEMYLKGDGVSKNCDQARVLLDSATLRGVKGAGERLRHLQAFGCQ
jgi:hypothetical protein